MDIRLQTYLSNCGEKGRSFEEIENHFAKKKNRPTKLDLETSLNTLMNRNTIYCENERYFCFEYQQHQKKTEQKEGEGSGLPTAESNLVIKATVVIPTAVERNPDKKPLYSLEDHIRMFGKDHIIEILPSK